MASRLSITKSGSTYTIRASSPRIKQVFWDWASGKKREAWRYGREHGAWRGDNTTWEWKANKTQITEFLVDIAYGMGRNFYESRQERDDALYVSNALSKKIA